MLTLQPNDLILNGTYRIEKELGHGAFGEVYQATHIKLKTKRAIKVIRRGESGLNDVDYQQYRERFFVEARIGASLHNQHIVPVHDFIDENDELFLVMDLEPGKSLADKIKESLEKNSPIPIEKAVKWIIEACQGLAELHSHEPPYVHRDIKPSNILIDDKDQACIADLGIIQLTTETRGDFSGGKNHPGTPAYMPPEQEPGHYLPLRPSADVYAMGCVLFQLLTGRQYYNTIGKRVKSLRFETPFWVDRIVAKAVTPDPQKRYADAKEMQKALQKRGRDYKIFLVLIVLTGLLLFGIGKLSAIPTRSFIDRELSSITLSRITDTPIPNNNSMKPKIADFTITNTSTIVPTKTRIPTLTSTITKTPIITLTPTLVPTTSILLEENFDDGKANDHLGDNSSPQGKVVFDNSNGYYSFIASGPVTYPGIWSSGHEDWNNYVFESNIRFHSQGVEVCFRAYGTSSGFYNIFLDPENDLSIFADYNVKLPEDKRYQTFNSREININYDQWYLLRIEVNEDNLSVFLDNKLINQANRSTHSDGGIGYYTGQSGKFDIDNIRVWKIE